MGDKDSTTAAAIRNAVRGGRGVQGRARAAVVQNAVNRAAAAAAAAATAAAAGSGGGGRRRQGRRRRQRQRRRRQRAAAAARRQGPGKDRGSTERP